MFKAANVGTTDRIIRLVVGALLIALPYATALELFASPVFYWGAQVVGAVLIVTALVRFCPAYTLFGLRTCKTTEA